MTMYQGPCCVTHGVEEKRKTKGRDAARRAVRTLRVVRNGGQLQQGFGFLGMLETVLLGR